MKNSPNCILPSPKSKEPVTPSTLPKAFETSQCMDVDNNIDSFPSRLPRVNGNFGQVKIPVSETNRKRLEKIGRNSPPEEEITSHPSHGLSSKETTHQMTKPLFNRMEERGVFIPKNYSLRSKTKTQENIKENLRKLKNAVFRFFNGDKFLQEETDMDFWAFDILLRIVKKKIGNSVVIDIEPDFFDTQSKKNIVEKLNFLLTKKIEEKKQKKGKLRKRNLDFVFRLAMGYLKEEFMRRNCLLLTKQNELKFYNLYFSQTAINHNISLKLFYDPSNKTGLKNPKFSFASSRYIKLVFLSEPFRRFMTHFIRYRLDGLYKKFLVETVSKILGPIEKKVNGRFFPDFEIEGVFRQFGTMINETEIPFPTERWEVEEIVTEFEKKLAK